MHSLRFGRKLNLPSTIAIKHQVRMLMAQYEVKKAEAEARPEVFRRQSSLAVPSVTTGDGSSRVNMDATRRNAPVGLTDLVVDDGPHNSDGLLLHAWDGPERGNGVHKQTCHGRLGRSQAALWTAQKSLSREIKRA